MNESLPLSRLMCAENLPLAARAPYGHYLAISRLARCLLLNKPLHPPNLLALAVQDSADFHGRFADPPVRVGLLLLPLFASGAFVPMLVEQLWPFAVVGAHSVAAAGPVVPVAGWQWPPLGVAAPRPVAAV